MIVYAILGVVFISLVALGKNDLRKALPLFAFYVIVLPRNVQIEMGLFPNITVHRVALMTILWLYFMHRKQVENDVQEIPLAKPIIINLLLTLISTLLSIDFTVSFKYFLSISLEFYLLYYILIKSLRDNDTIYQVWFYMFIALTFACLIGLIQQYFLWDPISLLPKSADKAGYVLSQGGRGIRPRSVFPHAILFGAAMVVGISYAIYFFSTTKKISSKVTILLIFCLMILGLYKSVSRGPWIALILLLFIQFYYSSSVIKKKIVLIWVAILMVLIVRPGLTNYLYNIYGKSINEESSLGASLDYRRALIPLAAEELSKSGTRFFFGYGPETFKLLELRRNFHGRLHHFWSCDSSWIGFLFSCGVLGFLSMIYLLMSILFIIYRYISRNAREARDVMVPSFANVLIIYFLMTNVAIYGWSQFGYLFWIIVATSLAYISLDKSFEQNLPL